MVTAKSDNAKTYTRHIPFFKKVNLKGLQTRSTPVIEKTEPIQPAFTCLKLILETLERGVKWRCQWCRSGDFIANFEHISHLALELLLLTLNM